MSESENFYPTQIDQLIEQLDRVRDGLCGYMGPTCDCKYGFPADVSAGTEQTGCPEIREVIGFLRQLQKLMHGGLPLLTWQEWDDSQRIMRGFTEDAQKAARDHG